MIFTAYSSRQKHNLTRLIIMDFEIKNIVFLAIKRWKIIVAVTIFSTLIIGLVSYFYLKDVYEASSIMIISSPSDTSQLNQLTENQYDLNVKLVNSYSVLCKTNLILNAVLSETKLPLTIDQLSQEITVTSENNTDIIKISVQDTNPNTATMIANALASVFVKEIPSIMKMSNVQILDTAIIPKHPVKPNHKLYIFISAIAGLLIGLFISLLIDYFDVTVKSAEQLEGILNIPVLGTVPEFNGKIGVI